VKQKSIPVGLVLCLQDYFHPVAGTGDGQLSLVEAVRSWIQSVGILPALTKRAVSVPAIASVPILGMLGMFLGFDMFIEAFPAVFPKLER
jgi:hypothetical protein